MRTPPRSNTIAFTITGTKVHNLSETESLPEDPFKGGSVTACQAASKVCPIFGHSLFFCCRPCPPNRLCRLLQGDFPGHGLPSFFKPRPKLLQTLPRYRIFNDAGIRKAVTGISHRIPSAAQTASRRKAGPMSKSHHRASPHRMLNKDIPPDIKILTAVVGQVAVGVVGADSGQGLQKFWAKSDFW